MKGIMKLFCTWFRTGGLINGFKALPIFTIFSLFKSGLAEQNNNVIKNNRINPNQF